MKASTRPLTDPTIRLRITELIDDFYGHVDREVSVADLFTEHSELKMPGRIAQGRQAVAGLLLSIAQGRRDKRREAFHFGGRISVSRLGRSQFHVRSLGIVVARDSGDTLKGLLKMSELDDIVEFDENGRCRFAKRSMTELMLFDLNPTPIGA